VRTVDDVRTFLRWYDHEDVAIEEITENPNIQPNLPDRLRGQLPNDIEGQSGRRDRQGDDGGSRARSVSLARYDPRARLLGYDEMPEDDWEPVDPVRVPSPGARDPVVENYDASVDTEGFDALAFYVPFHFDAGACGIYLREEGVFTLAARIYHALRDLGVVDKSSEYDVSPGDLEPDHQPWQQEPEQIAYLTSFDLAVEILLRHEWFHHQVELLAAYLEDARDELTYVEYHRTAYDGTFASTDCIEETLANSYVARSRSCANVLTSRDLFQAVFEQTTQAQPPAYRVYDTDRDSVRQLSKRLTHLLVGGDVDETLGRGQPRDPAAVTQLGRELPLSTDVGRRRGTGRVPVRVVLSDGSASPEPAPSVFEAIQLRTDYTIDRTASWDESYERADGSLRQLADNCIAKLEQNVALPGFRWEHCGGDTWYGRLNDQFRFVANRYDREQRVELLEFGDHDLPAEYGCYG